MSGVVVAAQTDKLSPDEVESIADAWTEEYQVIRAKNGILPDSSRPAPIMRCPRADWQSQPFDSPVPPGVYFVQAGRTSRPMRAQIRDSAPKLSSAPMPVRHLSQRTDASDWTGAPPPRRQTSGDHWPKQISSHFVNINCCRTVNQSQSSGIMAWFSVWDNVSSSSCFQFLHLQHLPTVVKLHSFLHVFAIIVHLQCPQYGIQWLLL